MPIGSSQTGAIPFIALAIVAPILLIICFVIIFSTGGISLSGSPQVTPIPTQRPEPTISPKPAGASTFVKVDQVIDLEHSKIIYCDVEAAKTVQEESNNFRKELQMSEKCLNSYEIYYDEQSAKLKSCLNSCDTANKSELKKCSKDFDDQLYGEYDLINCTNDSNDKLKVCKDGCNTGLRVLTLAEYNTNCRTPSVDQGFRLDDAVKQYCQDRPN